MEHVDQIKMKLEISGVLTEVNSWYCKSDPDHGVFGSQINMLIARKDQVINLCEMKYSQSEYTITEKMDRSIRNKISDFITVSGTVYICSSSSNYCSRAGRSINIRISSLGRRTSYVSTGGSDVNIFVFYL